MRGLLLFFFCGLSGVSGAQTYEKVDFHQIIGTDDQVKSFEYIPCSERDFVHHITASSRLNPNCIYRERFFIKKSNVTLDCRGATIRIPRGHGPKYGITVFRDDNGDFVENVTIRNCRLENRGIVIRHYDSDEVRAEVEKIPGGVDYEKYRDENIQLLNSPKYRILNNLIYDSVDSGIYVHRFVQGVLIQGNVVAGSSSAGIYLDADSAQNKILYNRIWGNGYQHGPGHFMDPNPNGVIEYHGGRKVRIRYSGREGLAIDASNNNLVKGNSFRGNASGGILIYKNNSEHYRQRPETFSVRKWGSFQNKILENSFVHVPNSVPSVGVWLGSRMSFNQRDMDHWESAYLKKSFCLYRALGICLYSDVAWFYQDSAKNNLIARNRFVNYPTAILVEDDRNQILDNEFHWTKPAFDRRWTAVSIQAPVRSYFLKKPVKYTIVRGNKVTLAGNIDPNCPTPLMNDRRDQAMYSTCESFTPYKRYQATVVESGNRYEGIMQNFNPDKRIKYNYGPYLFTTDLDVLL